MRRRALLAGLGAVLGGAAWPTTQAARRDGRERLGRSGDRRESRAGRRGRGDGFGPSGRLPLPGALEAVVSDGVVAYVAVGDGFVVVDVSDPAAPSLLAERRGILADHEDGPLTGVADVAVSGDRLLAVGPAGDRRAEVVEGVAVFDVSDPTSPERVGFEPRDGATHNATLDGRTAYLVGNPLDGDPVTVAEVTDDGLSTVARWSPADADDRWEDVLEPLYGCHDVTVRDGRAYAAFWDAGAWVLDVSDPATPEPVARLGGTDPDALAHLERADAFMRFPELPGNAHYVLPSDGGDVVAVGREAFDVSSTARRGGPGGITLWDASDPADPVAATTLAPPSPPEPWRFPDRTAHNFGWRGDRLYAAWYHGGVAVYDVADPTAPRVLASWRDPGRAFWTAVPAADGFVATSKDGSGDEATGTPDHLGGAVFGFPEPAGGGEPAATRTPVSTPTPVPDSTPTATPSPVPLPTATSTPSPTSTSTTTAGRSPGGESPSGTPDGTGIPGFGVLAALVGTAAAARLSGRES